MKPKFTKKEVLLCIIVSLVAFVLGALHVVFVPEKESKLIEKNRSGGENQMAIRQLVPVQSFLSYLVSIEHKDSLRMWNQSSEYRRKKLYHDNADEMMYDYFLTSKCEVQYVIPKAENIQNSLDGPGCEENRIFSFYALLRFEDSVSVSGEVDYLKHFSNIELEETCDWMNFEPLFEQVVNEVYDFVDCRFVIDSEEYVRNELKDYMMKMSMKDYVTQDWRFPINFVRKLGLKPKARGEKSGITTVEKLGHTVLCDIVMVEENNEWKVQEWRTIAISRW